MLAHGQMYNAAFPLEFALLMTGKCRNILCDWANLALKTVKETASLKWAFYGDKLRAKQLEERNIRGRDGRSAQEKRNL